MLKNYLLVILCALSLGTLTACSTSGDDSSALVEDGSSSDAQLGLDDDGSLTVGDPNAQDGFNGPAELQNANTIYFGFNSENIQDEYLAVMQKLCRFRVHLCFFQFCMNRPKCSVMLNMSEL